jgi:hypothetical protein
MQVGRIGGQAGIDDRGRISFDSFYWFFGPALRTHRDSFGDEFIDEFVQAGLPA